MELDFPQGTFLSTGTGIVPGTDFSLSPGDVVAITVGDMTLENPVARQDARTATKGAK
jgi:2-dehydro-3-deoxy-D-arabinonate dehydratase